MRLPLILFSFIFLSHLLGQVRAVETSDGVKSTNNSDRTKVFDIEKFRCILKIVYQRLFDEDMEKTFHLEEKQDKFSDDEQKQISNETLTRVNNLDTYVIKLRSFLNKMGEWKDMDPIHDLNDVTFIRLFNQIFIDFNNFKKSYREQFMQCGLEPVMVNTQARCNKVYGASNCELNKNKISYGVKCPEGYVKYKNYFCYIKCPEPYIDQSNYCQKPPHIKVSFLFF